MFRHRNAIIRELSEQSNKVQRTNLFFYIFHTVHYNEKYNNIK
jgi:hypothetical protein